MTVESAAIRMIAVKTKCKTTELDRWQREVMIGDLDYLSNTRCNQRHVNGECRCFERFSMERIASIAMQAHVSRDKVIDILRGVSMIAELRDYENVEPFAPDLQKRVKNSRRHNYPAPGQQKRKRGRPSLHADLKRAALDMAKQGKSSHEIGAKMNISHVTVLNWIKSERVSA